jgi:hypothetical protein
MYKTEVTTHRKMNCSSDPTTHPKSSNTAFSCHFVNVLTKEFQNNETGKLYFLAPYAIHGGHSHTKYISTDLSRVRAMQSEIHSHVCETNATQYIHSFINQPSDIRSCKNYRYKLGPCVGKGEEERKKERNKQTNKQTNKQKRL